MEEMEKAWRQQYLNQRAAIKTGIHSSIAARVAYTTLEKDQLQNQMRPEAEIRTQFKQETCVHVYFEKALDRDRKEIS